MTARAFLVATFTGLNPGQVYSLRIAIADVFDYATDSGVFIQAGSFGDGTSGTPSPVPEPATLILIGSGLIGISCLRNKV